MKLVSFQSDQPRAGAVIGTLVLDINAAQPLLPPGLDEIINRGLLAEVRNLVDNAAEMGKELFRPLRGLQLYPPVVRPGKIICLGRNYPAHAREGGVEPPKRPVIFSKAPTSLTGPFDPIEIRPGARYIDAEAELAVVIGRAGTMIPRDRAYDYIAGYMAFNDVTERKAQKDDGQWFRGKSFDTFAPCGPWIVTPEELGDPYDLRIVQQLNGDTMQDSRTGNMIFRIDEIIEHVSAAMTLLPGDIIATGTPEGVGVFRDPPVFLAEGDVVKIEIERIGILRNRVTRLEEGTA